MIWALPALTLLLQGLPSLASIWAAGKEYESIQAFAESGDRCATKVYTTEEIERIETNFEAEHKAITESRNLRSDYIYQKHNVDDSSINVYWWQIVDYSRATGDNGIYDESYITAQMAILNSYFNPEISFNLVHVQSIFDVQWFKGWWQDEMKYDVHYGSAHDLNIFTLNPEGYPNNPDDNYHPMGWSTYPNEYKGAPREDGVIINWLTLPGIMTTLREQPSPYEEGKHLVHQVGHWLGLYHTFQDGCRAVTRGGDWIESTAAELSPSWECIERDTCSGPWRFDGLDPIHNIMDYSYEYCQTGFVTEQKDRMLRQMLVYRNHKEADIPCWASTENTCPGRTVENARVKAEATK